MDIYSNAKLYLETQWQKLVDYCDGDDRMMACVGITLATMMPYFVVNFFYMILDVTARPACLMKYKIQKGKNSPIALTSYLRYFLYGIINELTTCLNFYVFYPLLEARGVSALNPLPDIWVVVIQLYVMYYVDEACFYYGHRFLHWPPIYKRFHKQHHLWTAPISLSSSYSHPVDNVIEGFLPLFVATLVGGCHVSVMWYYLVRGQISTLVHHSGYHLPFLHSPQFHDFHHCRFNECYGTGGILDRFHGTDTEFRKSVHSKRDVTFYELKPVEEIFPEEEKHD